jgi:hypothetical protein
MNQKSEPRTDSASHRGHGAHGKGVGGGEEHVDPADTTPPFANGADR